MRLTLAACLMFVPLLGSCGGSSGGGTPTPSPPPAANRPPAFTSAAIASAAENAAGTAYTAGASDPDGNTVTFALSGGTDRARFGITPAGALSFVAPPDFENPDDADGDNVYQVQLSASDGTASATLDLAVRVTNQGPDAFRVRRVASGLASPLFVTAIPDGSGRVFVVEKGGLIRILNPATGVVTPAPFLDVSGGVATDGERGLLGLAPAPDFATSRVFFVYLTNPAGNIEVRRYRTVAGNPDRADVASGDVILAIPHPGFSNHNGGWMDFDASGNLVIATGDGGGGGDPDNNAQNPASLLGKMLRIDVASDAFPADPSRDYALVAANSSGTEVWLSGLRNPWRASFDRVTGGLWIGDVGQGAVEEIDFVPSGTGALNFGWRLREGSQPYNGGANSAAFTPPVAEYGHGSGPLQGNSLTGGYVYRGAVEALRGNYFFGDFVNGNIWSFPVVRAVQGQTLASSAFTQRRAAFAPNAGTIGNIASFGQDQAGNLYIVDYDGEIFVVEPA